MSTGNEESRLLTLHSLELLDTAPEPAFDALVRVASHVCGTPIALVSLVDRARQWFKARVGIDASQTPREHAFCAHAIHTSDGMIIEDARRDPRFADNPLVVGGPGIRFYAGMPIRAAGKTPVGTLCVIDTVPRTLSAAQVDALCALATQAEQLIELRYAHHRISALDKRQRQLERHLRETEIREARRLAAELHDGIGQQLTGIGLGLGSLQSRLAGRDDDAEMRIGELALLVSDAIRQCRDLAYSEAAFTVEEAGLLSYLGRYCAMLGQGPGAAVRLHAPAALVHEPPARTGHHLFRIAQECVTNARRHADASHVVVALEESRTALTLTVDDDGRGLGSEQLSRPGLGIRSMRFRASEIGATLHIGRLPPGGTRIRCVLPHAAVQNRADRLASVG